jgi:hypothetical protein
MRLSFLLAFLACWLTPPGASAQTNTLGSEPERISRASALDEGHGVLVISIRSEIYLDEPLNVYFGRIGQSAEEPAQILRFGRRQGFFAFGNNTLKYQVRAYQLPAGRYRLLAHGIDCPKIPAEDERCLIDRRGLTGTVEVSRPSRGYGEEAPSFEVRPGSVTYAGDYALTARNTIEWSPIPPDELSRARQSFGSLPRAPEPTIPEDFVLKYALYPRSFEDDRGRRY